MGFDVETTKLTWDSKTGGYSKPKVGDFGPLAWKFIPGPIPLSGLAAAYGLGKRAMLVYLLAFAASRVRRHRNGDWGVIPARELKRFHLDAAGKSRSVAALAAAGVLEVKRQGHHSLRLRVTAHKRKAKVAGAGSK